MTSLDNITARFVSFYCHFFQELIVASKHPKDPMVYNDVAKLYGTDFLGYGLATEMDHSIWAIRRGIVDPGFHRR